MGLSKDGAVEQPLKIGHSTQFTLWSPRTTRRCEIAWSPALRRCPELLLALAGASPTDPRPRPRVDPEVLTRQRVTVFAVRLAKMPLILGVGCQREMIGIPAGVDTAEVMEFLALWDWAAEELPAKAVGVAVLGLGDAAVRGR
jgi:hypothetical protein